MAANQNIARLGVVLGIETGEYTREINEIIQKNKEMKREVDSATKAITREIEELAFATQNYGKTLTKVEQVEQNIQRLRYNEKNVGAALIRDLKAQAAAYDAKVAAAQKAADIDKKAGGLNKQQIAALGYQTTDIITGLAGGQNPLLVLIQQGGQLRDQFGGVKGVFDAFRQVLTPTKLLVGGLGTALAALAYAAYSGSKEFSRLRDDLILTNSFAGLSTARFNDLAQSLSTKLNVSIGDAKEGLGALVASGKFTQQSLESVGKAVLTFAKLAGVDAKDAAQELMGSFNGTAAGAKSLNDKYHFLNLEQYRNIELLEKQGKSQQAIAVTAKAFNENLQGQTREVGYLSAAWEGATNWLSKYWDKAKSIGAGKTDEERMRDAAKEVERLSANIRQNFNKESKEKLRQAMLDYDIYAQLVAKKQKDINAAQEETDKINEHKRAGGLERELDLKFTADKNAIEQRYALAEYGVNEITKIELEGEKKKELARLELKKRFASSGYGLAKQEKEAEAAEELKIDAETAQKKKELYFKHNEEIKKTQQSKLDQVKIEREKLELYSQNIFMSEAEHDLAVKRKETELAINKIMEDRLLGDEEKKSAVEREQQILKENEALTQQQEKLKALRDINQTVTSSMADAFEKFMMTGKLSFKDFFKSVLAGLIRIQAQMMAMKAMSGLGNLFGLTTGGPMELSGPTTYIGPTFADGGMPPLNVPSLVGERGPELFIPRTAGTIIPNNQLGQALGGTTNVTNYYIDAIDTKSFEQRILGSSNAVWAANQYANNKTIATSRSRT